MNLFVGLGRLACRDPFLGAILAILTWPWTQSSLSPATGLDPSWQGALELAVRHRLQYGTHFVFTYGPLGFLAVHPLYYRGTAIAALLFTLATNAVIGWLVVRSLRGTMPLALVLVVAYFTLAAAVFVSEGLVADGPELTIGLTLALCLSILRRPLDRPAPLWWWATAGFVAGLLALVKLSVGVADGALVAITLLARPTRRLPSLVSAAVGYLVAFLAGWFGTGNSLSNLATYLRSSYYEIAGYPQAMGVENSAVAQYWIAGLLFVIAAILALAPSRLPRGPRLGTLGATALAMWILFREGFVRHDAPHDVTFASGAVVVVVALVASSPGLRVTRLLAVLSTTGLAYAMVGSAPWTTTTPSKSITSLAEEARTLGSATRSGGLDRSARDIMQQTYALPAAMLHDIAGHRTSIEPWEENIAWAYPQVRFDPLPVIQDYSSYTTYLDSLDAAYVGSPAAPRYILEQPPAAIDGRDPAFEPPLTRVAIECRYRQVQATSRWQLLKRSPDRCGALQMIGSVHMAPGEVVRVPRAAPSDMVLARFQLQLSAAWQLENLLFKPPAVMLRVDGSNNYRFIPDTAGDLHILRPSTRLGYSPGYAPGTVSSLSISELGPGASPPSAKVTFYAQPVAGGQ